MSDISRSAPKPTAFELKSAQLPLVALLVKTADVSVLGAQWEAQYGSAPDFFDHEPLVVDLTPIASQPDVVPDFPAIIRLLHAHRVCAIAAKGGSPAQMQAALAAGLVATPDAVLLQAKTPAAPMPAAPPPPPASPTPPSPTDAAPPAAHVPVAAPRQRPNGGPRWWWTSHCALASRCTPGAVTWWCWPLSTPVPK